MRMKKLFLVLSALFLLSCAHTGRVDRFLDLPSLPSVKVEEPSEELLSFELELPRFEPPPLKICGKVSLSAKDAPAADVLKAVCDQVGCSLLFELSSPESFFSRKITLSVKDVPADLVLSSLSEALDAEISCADLSCRTLRVRDRVSFVWSFPLLLYDFEPSLKSSSLTLKTSGDLMTKIEEGLRKILDDGKLGGLSPSAGVLKIEGPPSKVKEAVSFLRQVLKDLSSYLYLKMWILKVDSKKLSEKGLSLEDVINLGENFKNSLRLSYSPGMPQTGGFSFQLTYDQFKAFLSVLETEHLAEVISAPAVLVRNGSSASIRLVQEVGWFEPGEIDTTVSNGVVVYKQERPAFKTKEVGFVITLIPRLLDQKRAELLLHLQDTDVAGYAAYLWQESPEVPAVELKYPLTAVREIVTQLVASSDFCTLIGGFRQKRSELSKSGIPVLKDLPVVGELFSYTAKKQEDTDLLIAVTFSTLSARLLEKQ